jgi:hypothetical protein
MTWAVYVARLGDREICWGNLKGIYNLEDLAVDGRIIVM